MLDPLFIEENEFVSVAIVESRIARKKTGRSQDETKKKAGGKARFIFIFQDQDRHQDTVLVSGYIYHLNSVL